MNNYEVVKFNRLEKIKQLNQVIRQISNLIDIITYEDDPEAKNIVDYCPFTFNPYVDNIIKELEDIEIKYESEEGNNGQ